jgi:hypothetical protein
MAGTISRGRCGKDRPVAAEYAMFEDILDQ